MTEIEFDLVGRIPSGDLTPSSILDDDEIFAVRLMLSERRLIHSSRGKYIVPDKTRREYADLKDHINQMAQQRAREETRQHAMEEADRAQAVVDKKQQQRHDFQVAAFGGLVTLFAEHFLDVVDFIKSALEIAGLFLFQ